MAVFLDPTAAEADAILAEAEANAGEVYIPLTPWRNLNVWRKTVTTRYRQHEELRYEWVRRWDDPDREPYAFHRFDLTRDEALELLMGTISQRMQDAIEETRQRFGTAPSPAKLARKPRAETALEVLGLEPSVSGSPMQKDGGRKADRMERRR